MCYLILGVARSKTIGKIPILNLTYIGIRSILTHKLCWETILPHPEFESPFPQLLPISLSFSSSSHTSAYEVNVKIPLSHAGEFELHLNLVILWAGENIDHQGCFGIAAERTYRSKLFGKQFGITS